MIVSADFLAGLERRAAWVFCALALLAFFWRGAAMAAGVAGGAILSGLSYWGIKRGVDGLAQSIGEASAARRKTAQALTMLVGRYALLALIAYVMISRLRLSPLGLLMGASVIPIAAFVQVLAAMKKTTR